MSVNHKKWQACILGSIMMMGTSAHAQATDPDYNQVESAELRAFMDHYKDARQKVYSDREKKRLFLEKLERIKVKIGEQQQWVATAQAAFDDVVSEKKKRPDAKSIDPDRSEQKKRLDADQEKLAKILAQESLIKDELGKLDDQTDYKMNHGITPQDQEEWSRSKADKQAKKDFLKQGKVEKSEKQDVDHLNDKLNAADGHAVELLPPGGWSDHLRKMRREIERKAENDGKLEADRYVRKLETEKTKHASVDLKTPSPEVKLESNDQPKTESQVKSVASNVDKNLMNFKVNDDTASAEAYFKIHKFASTYSSSPSLSSPGLNLASSADYLDQPGHNYHLSAKPSSDVAVGDKTENDALCRDQALKDIIDYVTKQDPNQTVISDLFELARQRMNNRLSDPTQFNRALAKDLVIPRGQKHQFQEATDQLKEIYQKHQKEADLAEALTFIQCHRKTKAGCDIDLTSENASAAILLMRKDPASQDYDPAFDFTEVDASAVWAYHKIREAKAASGDKTYEPNGENGKKMDFVTQVKLGAKVDSATLAKQETDSEQIFKEAISKLSDETKKKCLGIDCGKDELKVIKEAQKRLMEYVTSKDGTVDGITANGIPKMEGNKLSVGFTTGPTQALAKVERKPTANVDATESFEVGAGSKTTTETGTKKSKKNKMLPLQIQQSGPTSTYAGVKTKYTFTVSNPKGKNAVPLILFQGDQTSHECVLSPDSRAPILPGKKNVTMTVFCTFRSTDSNNPEPRNRTIQILNNGKPYQEWRVKTMVYPSSMIPSVNPNHPPKKDLINE